jgi:hypothetical protein
VIVTLEAALRLHRHPHGTLARNAKYLHRRTGGMIGSLSHLIRAAAQLSILEGEEAITRKLMDTIPVDYVAESDGDTEASPLRRGVRRVRGREHHGVVGCQLPVGGYEPWQLPADTTVRRRRRAVAEAEMLTRSGAAVVVLDLGAQIIFA